MSLRGRIKDSEATYLDPVLGVNLHSSEEDLQRGESSNMKNMVRFGRLVSRLGSSRITATQVAASFAVKGGHKFYYGGANPTKARLITYDTNISTISDAGAEVKIWTTLTSNKDMFYNTWSITDQVYMVNSTDAMLRYDGTFVGPVGSTNIRSASYAWTLSGSGTNEYYVRTAAGGDPSLSDPTSTGGVYINGASATNGTAGSLAAGEWDYGNTDTLGYNTVYVRLSDGTDPDTKSTGYVQHLNSATVPGVAGNDVGVQVIGVLDRLMCITAKGIERSDPRDPTVWSVDSTWATLRPSQSGTFKAHIPHMVSNEEGSPINGALAMTENAYYFYTGTDFGADVTAGTASAGEDSSIQYIDQIGAFGPRSVTSVPGVGTFWLTTNKNVFYVPTGHTRGTLVGTRINNTGGSATEGLEVLNLARGDEAWMVYSEPYLMLGFVKDGGTVPLTQYWLDIDKFRQDSRVPVWYGPMTGQSISAVWQENQQGDNTIVAGEGDSSVGVFVYTLRSTNVYTDKVGTNDNNIACEYSTYHKSGGSPSREKLVQGIEVDMSTITGTATADIADLRGNVLVDVPLEKTFT